MDKSKLKALIISFGAIILGGVTYAVWIPTPAATGDDFIDAGIANSVKHRISCEVRNVCPDFDGGRYKTVELRAYRDGTDMLVQIPRVADRDCWQLVGDVSNACSVVEANACSDPTICTGATLVRDVVSGCACSKGPLCLVSGLPAIQGATLAAGTWAGADCVPKTCREVAGDQGFSWPDSCPR